MKQPRDGILTTPGQRDMGKKSCCWSLGQLGWAEGSRTPARVKEKPSPSGWCEPSEGAGEDGLYLSLLLPSVLMLVPPWAKHN